MGGKTSKIKKNAEKAVSGPEQEQARMSPREKREVGPEQEQARMSPREKREVGPGSSPMSRQMHPAYSKDDELPRSAAICRDLIINELKQGDSSEKHMHHLFDILETTYGHSASDYIVSATKAFDVRFVRVLLSRPNPPDLVSREKAFLAAAEAGCPEIAKLLNSDDLRPGIHTKALILALRMSGSESGAPPAYSDIE